MYNADVAEILERIADMLELEEGDRRFEILAYRKAAMTLGAMQEDVSEIYKKTGLKVLWNFRGSARA